MKCGKYLLLPLAIACINVAQADTKHLSIPFYNEPIFSYVHDGLAFYYDLGDNPAKKLVCKLSFVYKGWFEFRSHGELRESGTYGDADGIDTLTFTNRRPSVGDLYYADRAGSMKIHAIEHAKAPYASASCHYELDDI